MKTYAGSKLPNVLPAIRRDWYSQHTGASCKDTKTIFNCEVSHKTLRLKLCKNCTWLPSVGERTDIRYSTES